MKSARSLAFLASSLCLVLIMNCGTESIPSGQTGGPDANGIVTTREGNMTVVACSGGRDSVPASSLQDVAALVKGNTDFACDMYKKVSGAGNTFFSPYSISACLAMTYAGASGDTERQTRIPLAFYAPEIEAEAVDKIRY